MSIDLEKLLREVSTDAPSGENLEYDPGFAELERLARGKPEQVMGDTVIPGEEPSWRAVRAKAEELFGRSKDLRVAVTLTRALLSLEGLPGFRDGLGLVRGLIERQWDTLHPQLDPDDDNDPTMRVNALAPLNDSDTTLRSLREAILVESRAVGRFSYRDFLLATGALPVPEGKAAPEFASVDGAFADAPLEAVQATEQALAQSLEHVRAIETGLTDRVGSELTADLSPLTGLLRSVRQLVSERLARRIGATAEGEADAGGASPEVPGTSARNSDAHSGPRAGAAPGEIRSRDDVIKTLERLCEFYERHEPSSPLPLLLKRAQRLVKKSFVEIIRDLAPDALSQVEQLRGVDTESE